MTNESAAVPTSAEILSQTPFFGELTTRQLERVATLSKVP